MIEERSHENIANRNPKREIDPRFASSTGVRRRLMIVAALMVGATVGGCSDKKEANKENFKVALTSFFSKNCLMIPLTNVFPGTTQAIAFPYQMTGSPGAEGIFPKLVAFVHSRVIEMKTVPTSRPSEPANYLDFTYDLTEAGRALYRAPNALGPGSPPGLCAGHIRVVSIDRFTEPADQVGRRVSQVTFTGEPQYDDWTKDIAIQETFTEQLSKTQPLSQTLPLVLMNDGWSLDMSMPLSN